MESRSSGLNRAESTPQIAPGDSVVGFTQKGVTNQGGRNEFTIRE